MTSTIRSLCLVSFAGIGLALTGCSSQDLGASAASVTGVGDVCTVNADCVPGLECEHGSCQQHNRRGADAGVDDRQGEDQGENENENENENEHAGADGGVACQLDTDCAAGQECDDGFCKAHDGGDDSSGGGGSGHGGHDGSDG